MTEYRVAMAIIYVLIDFFKLYVLIPCGVSIVGIIWIALYRKIYFLQSRKMGFV